MPTEAANPKTLDIKEIIKILPHRYPFLLVDKVLDYDIEKGYIIAQKNLTYNEEFFQGHFPHAPIMPGVLSLEALAQTGGIFIHLRDEYKKIAVLLNINNAKFRNPARPGDVLILRCDAIHLGPKGGRVHAKATVNDKVVAEADIGFAAVDMNQL